jgi:transcriptional regulator PpsR
MPAETVIFKLPSFVTQSGEIIIQASPNSVNGLSTPDITLTLDMNAVIRDVSVSNTVSDEFVQTWLGRPWIETVADSGIEKARRSLSDAREGGVSAFRRILQRFPSGLELPIEYTTVRLGAGAGLIAVGRSLQASSELQSRLIAAQQAMERDYWKLREVETRYRLLFDASNDAVLVLNSEDLRVVDANPAAIRALGLTRGWDFLNEIAPREHGAFRDMLVRARESGRTPGGVFHVGADGSPWILRPSLLNDDAAIFYMLQLVSVTEGRPAKIPAIEPAGLAGLVQAMPDGFVVLDRAGVILDANPSFLRLVEMTGEGAVVGHRLDRWLGRGADDLDALLSALRRRGVVRLFSTTLRGQNSGRVDVEISAGGNADEDPAFVGVVVRELARRNPAVGPGSAPALPALNDASTPLKTLVQAAVAVVERHYVETALRITDGNRTAAAERLGLSRQSLYAKLNRYGLDSVAEGESPKSD